MAIHVRSCLLCGQSDIETDVKDNVVHVICGACGAEFTVEWDPPDAPGITARIELLGEPSGDLPENGPERRDDGSAIHPQSPVGWYLHSRDE